MLAAAKPGRCPLFTLEPDTRRAPLPEMPAAVTKLPAASRFVRAAEPSCSSSFPSLVPQSEDGVPRGRTPSPARHPIDAGRVDASSSRCVSRCPALYPQASWRRLGVGSFGSVWLGSGSPHGFQTPDGSGVAVPVSTSHLMAGLSGAPGISPKTLSSS